MPEFTLDGRPINYQVRFSSRRSISIKILSAQCLEITAPLHTSSQAIENALLAKSRWLQKHIARFASMAAININREILHGAQVLYLGQRRQLFLCASCLTAPGVTLEGDTLVIVTDTVPAETQAAKLLKDWYIQQATDILPAKTALWATKIGIQPQRVTIREQKSRWGSCSNRGNINYNWRIIMAPPEVIDYLIVHELCHLKVPNHSPAFWHLVAEQLPNYKLQQTWLKTNGPILMRLFAATDFVP